MFEINVNIHQMNKLNRLYAHQSHKSNNVIGAISPVKGLLLWEVYGYEECPDKMMDALLSEPPFREENGTNPQIYGFKLYGKLGVDFFSSSELLFSNIKVRVRIIRARPNFYMNNDNPSISVRTVDCSLYTRHIALKDYYHKETMVLLAFTLVAFKILETPAKTFIFYSRRKHFIQENCFNKHSIRRIAFAVNTKTAFIGSNTEKLFWYRQLDF